MSRLLAFLCLVSFSLSSFGERLLPISFEGQPVILLDEGRPSSCGIRILGIQSPLVDANPNEELWVPDGSFMVHRSGVGFVKAIANKILEQDMLNNRRPNEQPIKGFWFKADGKKATVPIKPVVKGETKFSLIYATEFSSVADMLDAILSNKSVQFALQFPDNDAVSFYGKVTLSPEEIEQVLGCMSELSDLLQGDINTKP